MRVSQSGTLKATDLNVSAKGSVVQSSASRPVGNVDVAEQRDQSLRAAHRFVAGGNVERRLPVLVPRVHVGAVLHQRRYCILQQDPAREMCLAVKLNKNNLNKPLLCISSTQ